MSTNGAALLEVENLRVDICGVDSTTRIVRDVSLSVPSGHTLGIVGESGCGKTMTMMALVGLLPEYALASADSIRWRGEEVDLATLRAMRGSEIGVVFQDPMASLNPLMRVGPQIEECLRRHGATRRDARSQAVALLDEVGIRDPERCARLFPWELSGGMAQRVMIATALAPEPSLLIADEPTTAIDASMRKKVLALIGDLQRSRGLAVLLVSHDLAVVRSQSDAIAVMYAGQVVERGGAADVAERSRHPYTGALIACTLDPFGESVLSPIGGEPPRPDEIGVGCAFRSRCTRSTERCSAAPDLRPIPDSTVVACWNPSEEQL